MTDVYRSPLTCALELACQGIASFPCNTDKRPTTPHGFKDATVIPNLIIDLWRCYPGLLVGIRTGSASGLDVLDVDAKHPEAVAWFCSVRQQLPRTRVHRTRGGGLHLYFQHAGGVRCSTGRIIRGVDIRAEDGCAIWWPAWGLRVLCDAPVAEWPGWLLAQCARPSPENLVRRVVPDDRALASLYRLVANAQEGERNALLFWAACRAGEMVATGLIEESYVVDVLVDAGVQAGLLRAEALATAQGGVRRGGAR